VSALRHVFILNPVAGKGQQALELEKQIKAYFEVHSGIEYRIINTDSVGAATRIAQKECAEGGKVRLYACGGDGTLQETAAGIPFGYDDAELAVIPCGSGNDFVRVFGGRDRFLNLAELIEGVACSVDAVDCGDRISLNIASIGMDASVGHKMQRYKNWPFVSGSMAYNLAVVDVFCHPIGVKMNVEIEGVDGPIKRSGKYLMTLAANGQYYGGGYCGAPKAVVNDGLLEFVLVKKISRFKIPFFLGKYKAGRHNGVACIERIPGTSMKVCAAKPMVCNVDGECFKSDMMTFTVVPNAYRLVLPVSVAKEKGLFSAEAGAKV